MTVLRLWIDAAFGRDSTACRWWHYAADGRLLAQGSSEPRHWPGAQADGKPPLCELLLSADQASGVAAALPPGRAARDADVVRYAVEDQLIDDVDSLHLTVGSARNQRDDGRVDIVAIDRQRLAAILSALRQLGFAPTRAVVAAQALTRDATRVLLADDTATVSSTAGWVALPTHDMDTLRWAIARAGGEPVVHAIAGAGNDAGALAAACGGRLGTPLDAATLCRDGLNLLHGEFAPPRHDALGWRQWMPLAKLAGVAVAIGWLVLVGNWAWLRHANGNVRAEQAALVKQTLPDVSVVVAPALQMQRGIDSRRHARGELGESDLLPLLAALADAGGGAVENVSYRDARLQVSLRIPAANLAALREALRARGVGSSVRSADGDARVVLTLSAGELT